MCHFEFKWRQLKLVLVILSLRGADLNSFGAFFFEVVLNSIRREAFGVEVALTTLSVCHFEFKWRQLKLV